MYPVKEKLARMASGQIGPLCRLRQPLFVMKYSLAPALFGLLAALNFGCHAIETSTGSSVSGSAPRTALPYYLPQAEVSLIGDYVDILGDDGKPNGKVEFKVDIQAIYSADLDALRFACLTTNPMFDEESGVKTVNGLLNTSVAIPADRTGDAVVTLAKIGLSGANLFANIRGISPFGVTIPDLALSRSTPVKPFKHVFDPLAPGAIEGARTALRKSGFSLHCSQESALLEKAVAPPLDGPADRQDRGLAYRVPLPVALQIAPLSGWGYDKGKGSMQYNATVLIPDRSTCEVIPFRRVLFSKRETKVSWIDGVPVELSLKQPSPIIGGLSIPLQVLGAAGESIPAIIQIRNNAPVDRLNAESNRIDAEARLLESQRKLEALRAAVE